MPAVCPKISASENRALPLANPLHRITFNFRSGKRKGECYAKNAKQEPVNARRTPHVRQGQSRTRHARRRHVWTRDAAARLEMVNVRQAAGEHQKLRGAAPAISRRRTARRSDGRRE